MTKVSSFVHLKRLVGGSVTGVGRHAIEMLSGLSQAESLDLEIIAAKDDVAICSGHLPEKLKAVRVRELPMNRGNLEMMWKSAGIPKVDRWLKSPDWIYCPAEAFVPTKHAKLAVTIHDLHAYESELPWSGSLAHLLFSLRWRIMLLRVIRRADVLLTVSEFSRQRIRHFLKASDDKICVVGNGVDITRFIPIKETQQSFSHRYILVVGGLTARKGGKHVLEVASSLAKLFPKIKIKVIGRCETDLLSEAQAVQNIELLGYVEDSKLPEIYGQAAALYFPAIYEGFGIPVVEALACGIPVVSSNHPAVVEAGRGATITLPAHATAEAASVLSSILTDKSFSEFQRQRALSVRDSLDWSSCVQRLVNILQA